MTSNARAAKSPPTTRTATHQQVGDDGDGRGNSDLILTGSSHRVTAIPIRKMPPQQRATTRRP